MKTQKSIFQAFLKKWGFRVSEVLSTFDLYAHYYIDKDKNHNLIDKISCCIFILF